MMLAKADLPTQGFVLDYQTVTGTFTNYTFQGDSTLLHQRFPEFAWYKYI